MEYFGFEGIIPEGVHGAGEVKIRDTGTFVPLVWDEERIEVVLLGKGIYRAIQRYPVPEIRGERLARPEKPAITACIKKACLPCPSRDRPGPAAGSTKSEPFLPCTSSAIHEAAVWSG
jgi:hypothetical protein